MSTVREKLSNYGDTLKPLVLSYNGNIISGWSNYSGKVTSQKMNESEMGDRVSKSSFNALKGVKEQRVDGSCLSSEGKLRYTLMAHESGYPVRIPSNLNLYLFIIVFVFIQIALKIFQFYFWIDCRWRILYDET